MPEKSEKERAFVPNATLGEIMRLKFALRVTCASCLHVAVIRANDLFLRYGLERRLPTLRFRCRRCGSRSGRPDIAV